MQRNNPEKFADRKEMINDKNGDQRGSRRDYCSLSQPFWRAGPSCHWRGSFNNFDVGGHDWGTDSSRARRRACEDGDSLGEARVVCSETRERVCVERLQLRP